MLGVRFCFGLGYLKGGAIICISIYTFALLQHYGADIGEKFHLSSDTTVSATPRSIGNRRTAGLDGHAPDAPTVKLCLKPPNTPP